MRDLNIFSEKCWPKKCSFERDECFWRLGIKRGILPENIDLGDCTSVYFHNLERATCIHWGEVNHFAVSLFLKTQGGLPVKLVLELPSQIRVLILLVLVSLEGVCVPSGEVCPSPRLAHTPQTGSKFSLSKKSVSHR